LTGLVVRKKFTVANPLGSGIIEPMQTTKGHSVTRYPDRAELITLIIEHNVNRGIKDANAFIDQLYIHIQHDTYQALVATLAELEETI
jgi:hypothetical protein